MNCLANVLTILRKSSDSLPLVFHPKCVIRPKSNLSLEANQLILALLNVTARNLRCARVSTTQKSAAIKTSISTPLVTV